MSDNYFNAGDLVVGSPDSTKSVFSTTGAKLKDTTSREVGDPELLASRRQAMLVSMQRNGGTPVVPGNAVP